MQAITQRPVGAPASASNLCARVNARGPARSHARPVIRARAISTGGGSPVDAAWRGTVPKQSTLPVNPDGSVDYARIDASPISKVLTATIRKLLVAEVGGVDKDPRPWTEFAGIMNAVREVNDMDGTARDVQIRAKRVFGGKVNDRRRDDIGAGIVPLPLQRPHRAGGREWRERKLASSVSSSRRSEAKNGTDVSRAQGRTPVRDARRPNASNRSSCRPSLSVPSAPRRPHRTFAPA